MFSNLYNVTILLFILFFLLNYFFLKYNILLDSQSHLDHKKYANLQSTPYTGGIVLVIYFLFLYDLNFIEKLAYFSMFLLGLLSDSSKIVSAKKRFLFQILIVIVFIKFENILIFNVRVDYINYLLNNYYLFQLFFTVFCLVILINGSNFIDGLNVLNAGYYIIIFFNLSYFFYDNGFDFISANPKLILGFLLVFFFYNILNKSFFGDAGSYLIGFYTGVLLIEFIKVNDQISPYYIAMLLWYPSFEILFTLCRRIFFDKKKINTPDNYHLHHLIFKYIKKKIKNINFSNSLSGLVINLFNAIIIFISSHFFYSSSIQIFLILLMVTIYISIYIILRINSLLKL